MDPNAPAQPYVPPLTPTPGGAPSAYPMPPVPGSGAFAAPPNLQPLQPTYAPAPPSQPYLQPVQPANLQPIQSPLSTNSVSNPSDQSSGDPRQELIEHLKKANNVLVTVSNNPSVDQLSAAIGLTLVLNKLDKHATAVYSGKTPSAIEFLQPDQTLEKNTDSLRDFIIALDKAKADKLRYKVEDKFVKIFITPYHTSITDKDLDFSQGDFNVDVVIAIGAHRREELDEAITAHGRILHDAVTVSVNNKQTSDLGTLNWFAPDASSLCEMLVGLIEPLQADKALLDSQIATAFLTGVVAETERFSNEKTSAHTMNIAATLMKAGANQQLVSSKLDVPEPMPKEGDFDTKKLDELAKQGTNASGSPTPTVSQDGSLAIAHKKDENEDKKPSKTLQDLEKENHGGYTDDDEDSNLAKIHIDEEGTLVPANKHADAVQSAASSLPAPSNMILQPPTLGGDMSSATKPEEDPVASIDEPATDHTELQHAKTVQPLTDEEKDETLEQIEEKVGSPHLTNAPSGDTDGASAQDAAREAVNQANAAIPGRLEPISALNAQSIELKPEGTAADAAVNGSQDLTTEEIFPPQLVGPDRGLPPDPTAGASDPGAPPPVPPPLMPPPA